MVLIGRIGEIWLLHDRINGIMLIKTMKYIGGTLGKERGSLGMKRENVQRRNHQKTFANGLNFYKLFWIFFIGCFLGVVIEVLFGLITTHKLESRAGLVYGPFNPVYGFGAVLMTVCLYKLREKRDLWILLSCMVIGAAFEYLCSYLQELVLGTVSWQYSDQMFSIQGRTSLLYAFFWGILGVFWIKVLFPFLSRLIEKIPAKVGIPVTWILVAFMVFNMAVSLMALERQAQRREQIPADNAVARLLDERFPDSRLDRIYCHMYVVDGTGQTE